MHDRIYDCRLGARPRDETPRIRNDEYGRGETISLVAAVLGDAKRLRHRYTATGEEKCSI